MKRPSPMHALDAAQINCHLLFKPMPGLFAEKMHHQYIFRRNGRIRLQFEDEMAIWLLHLQQLIARAGYAGVKRLINTNRLR